MTRTATTTTATPTTAATTTTTTKVRLHQQIQQRLQLSNHEFSWLDVIL